MKRRNRPSPTRFKARRGTTLVEVLLATLLLAILALAGAAFLYHSGAAVRIEQDRGTALNLANARLEALRSSPFERIHPPSNNYDVYFLSIAGSAWEHSRGDPGETVSVNGRSVPIVTTVQYEDVDGGLTSYDMIRVVVRIGFRLNRPDRVILETVIGP